MPGNLVIAETAATLELVQAGLGVAVVGRWVIEPQIRAGHAQGRPHHAEGRVVLLACVYLEAPRGVGPRGRLHKPRRARD